MNKWVRLLSLFVFLSSLVAPVQAAIPTPYETANGYIRGDKNEKLWFRFERSQVISGPEEISISQFDSPKGGDSWMKEEAEFKNDLEFVRYHYRQNQLQDEGSIQLNLEGKLEFQYSHEGKEKRVVKDLPERLAVPPMIENIIRSRWSSLINGKSYSFNLAIADRMDFYGFELSLDRREEKESRPTYTFVLKASSPFVAAVAKSVYFSFDANESLVQVAGYSPVRWPNRSGNLEEREAEMIFTSR